MGHDLVIRNGVVVDGTGGPRFRGDVAVDGDRIVRIGDVPGRGAVELDAEGHVVTPGFVDGHTHMDAQVFWDALGASACWHGVTTVVMGNCGFTLAPSVPGEEHLVLANLEKAEDIPAEAMAAGIDWRWDTFPAYLDAVDARPKAINYAAQIGHSALRTSVMGERAFTEAATENDLDAMVRALGDALRAGAVGFTTSISDHHWTSDGRPVASRIGGWEEMCRLVEAQGGMGLGVFELATDTESTESPDAEVARRFYDRLGDLSVRTGVPISYGLRHEHHQAQLDAFDAAAARGGRMFGQCRSEPTSLLYSFLTDLPLDDLPVWRDLRAGSFDDQLRGLRDPAVRRELVSSADTAWADAPSRRDALGGLEVVGDGPRGPALAGVAGERGVGVVEAMVDLALATDLRQIFVRRSRWDEEEALAALRHPRTVMTFSDAGAHVTKICGATIQTTLLSEWVREREALTLEEAVRMLTQIPAATWGLHDRGVLAEGMVADLNVLDPATVGLRRPTIELDLPGGAPRVQQKADGYLATVVAGQVTFRAGEHTGALPGRLLRGGVVRPSRTT
jgi:N-acyl-D-aspartate/D-glutamate deacylase